MDLNEKVEIPNNPGFYITRNGDVYNSEGYKYKLGTHRQGYANLKLDGKMKYLHRLLAKTFIPNPDKEKRFVNHIDGNVRNNDISNLEWVTSRQNVDHAYDSGLSPNNIPIEAKDLRTGDVLEFRSYRHCAKHFGVTRTTINACLEKRDKAKLLLSFYLLRKKNEPWPTYDEADVGSFGDGLYRPVLVINQRTGEKIVFITLKMAAEHIGVSDSSLSSFLKRTKNKPYHGYIVSYVANIFELDELRTKYEVVEAREIERRPRAPAVDPIPIEVKDRLGNRETWESAEAFAKAHGVSRETLQASIWRIGGWQGFKIRYLR